MKQQRCMGCMQIYASYDNICPFCGYADDTPAKEAYHLQPGSSLHERYTVGRSVGFGGFGITYLAWDNKLMQKVAIKEYMPSEYATRVPGNMTVTIYDGDRRAEFLSGLQKFLDEAQRLAKFQNTPGIVRILDSFAENLTAYIVMEYLEGETLKQHLLNCGGKVPYEDAVEIILPILASLTSVHNAGIIHRDISPDNIFLTNSGEVKLLDFGAARYASSGYSKSLSVILKPGYAPAEQYLSHGEQGPWSDVYATAATMYRMITGVVPEEALERKEHDNLKPPSALGVKLPKNAEKAILNALNVRIENRTPSAEVFEEQLLATADVIRVKEKGEQRFSLRMPTWMKLTVAAAVLLVSAGIGLFASGILKLGLGSHIVFDTSIFGTGEVNTPGVINLTTEEGRTAASSSGLTLKIDGSVSSSNAERGIILSQTPTPGEKVSKNTELLVEISSGPEYALVPDIVDTLWIDSEKQLTSSGFVPKVFYEESSVVPEGVVISIGHPAETKFPAGEKIAVTVSSGPSSAPSGTPVVMPDISDLTYADAKAALQAAGLYVVRYDDHYNNDLPYGTILEQSAETGDTLKTGDIIFLSISLGEKKVVVPDLQYMTALEAERLLTRSDLLYSEYSSVESNDYPLGTIVSQNVDPGEVVTSGTTIPVLLSEGAFAVFPNTVGEDLSRVETELNSLGFTNVTYSGVYSTEKAKNTVIQQSVNSGRISVETPITITYSLGEQPWPKTLSLSKNGTRGGFSGAAITGAVCDISGDNLVLTFYYTIDENASSTYEYSCFSPPEGEQFMVYSTLNRYSNSQIITISGSAIRSSSSMTLKLFVNTNGNGECDQFWSVKNFSEIRSALIAAIG